MVKLDPAIARLVGELETRLGLDETEARRAAFVVVAYSRKWSKSKIARYLGITRARVGQRVKKFLAYHESGSWPNVSVFLADIDPVANGFESKHLQVAFSPDAWQDCGLANALLNHALETIGR